MSISATWYLVSHRDRSRQIEAVAGEEGSKEEQFV